MNNLASTIEIIILTLLVCTISTVISALLAIPSGMALGVKRGKTSGILRTLCTTLVGIPPILAGLAVYMLLRNGGAFGSLRILFSPAAIVFAQVLIIFPTVAAGVFPAVRLKSEELEQTLQGLNVRGLKKYFILLREFRPALVTAVLTGFGRAISEVGAVMLVGGNILHRTRVMTTAIVLETSQGNFSEAFTLGAVLLLLSFAINFAVRRLTNDHF